MPLNLNHFLERGRGSGDLSNEQLTEKEFLKLLTDRINSVDVEKARADVIRFIPDGDKLDIWSKKYFNDLSMHILLQ